MSRVSAREAVAVVVAVALVGVGYQAWQTGVSGWQSLHTHPPPLQQRELGGVLYGSMDAAIAKATRIIPRGALYSIATGDSPPPDPSFAEAVPGVFRYFLLPRRYTPDVHQARWIVTFHHPSETLGVPVAREIPLAQYANLVEVGP
jgi:hypothetical protein